MAEPCLRFPVVCPQCGAENLLSLSVATIATALLRGTAIELRVNCHALRWSADPAEIEQIREYLASIAELTQTHLDLNSSPKVITHGERCERS